MKINFVSTSGTADHHVPTSYVAQPENSSEIIVANSKELDNQKSISKTEKDREIEGLNKWLKTSNTHLKFQLHEKLNEYYVQIINDDTSEVIREVPSKKMMDMVAKMHEMVGLLVDEKR